MEFKIQRYQGNEDEEAKSPDKQSILFQARIEERRRNKRNKKKEQSEEESQENDTLAQINDEKENVKRKDRKIKDGGSSAKKKKKKHQQEVGEVTNVEIEETLKAASPRKKVKYKLVDGNLPSKKKKSINSLEMDIDGDDNHNVDPKDSNEKDNCSPEVEDTESDTLKTNDISNGEILEGKGNATSLAICEFENNEEENPSEEEKKNGEENVVEDVSKSNDVSNNNTPDQSTEKYFPILGKHNKVKKAIVKRTLPRWLNEPICMAADIHLSKVDIKLVDFLSETTLKNLTLNEIDYLFPVQCSVIPKIMSQNVKTINKCPPSDICVQAPTGSGKTLAYVLPIIEVLSKYIVRQLYCLVILPSKDLAAQVYKVFDMFVTGTRLKVALASGLKTFAKEQDKLATKGGCSKVDILVCTPGRLVDHLKQTPGFNLKHLRFLVVDEADRLLGQDYHNWLDEVKMSVHSQDDYSLKRHKMIPINPSAFLGCQMPFQKLLFSATLTQNPEKIAPLELFHPLLFTSKMNHSKVDEENVGEENLKDSIKDGDGERYIMPENLEEEMIVVDVDHKPLVLVYLMLTMKWKGVLCFTKSIEATHRLCLLLQSFQGFTVAEFSSSLSETQRKGIIRDLNSGKVDLLISSDAMARGMDIDTVKLVVNYDTAANAKTYVHRVGRTARAGKKGCAMTILCSKEVYHFKLMIKKLSDKAIPKLNIPKKTLEGYQEEYQVALSRLKDVISLENRNKKSGNIVKKT